MMGTKRGRWAMGAGGHGVRDRQGAAPRGPGEPDPSGSGRRRPRGGGAARCTGAGGSDERAASGRRRRVATWCGDGVSGEMSSGEGSKGRRREGMGKAEAIGHKRGTSGAAALAGCGSVVRPPLRAGDGLGGPWLVVRG
ncbi:hypothetical protein ZWY2020_034601 [Hordeum vulgare]|nr:hypothetical protein ZWY2020_034601 [Hordeum vulgare]